jgi:hypothetical protein
MNPKIIVSKISQDGTIVQKQPVVGGLDGETYEDAFLEAMFFLSGEWDETGESAQSIVVKFDKESGRSVAEDEDTGDVYTYEPVGYVGESKD